MPTIERLSALEILDSRGRPTVQATCVLSSGAGGTASVPSGASTGAAEALELRDGDKKRYGGLGVRHAVAHVNEDIHHALAGQNYVAQAELDRTLIALDGTANKSRLGANAILAVSLAFARACAAETGIPLYRYFASLRNHLTFAMPRLMVNLFSGGKHAGGQVSIQDLLIVPNVPTIADALPIVYAIYYAAAQLVQQRYGLRLLRADEGGQAPPFESLHALFEVALESIAQAGYRIGEDVSLAVDVAASQFYRQDGRYELEDSPLTGEAMVDALVGWVERYPIISIEDGLAEEDWAHWSRLKQGLNGRALTLGDDLLCTNPNRIEQAFHEDAADALLLKVNQIGTLTEALHALQTARNNGWHVVISARSGETEDHWLADLAVGWSADYIKIGSITQSERLAKYNRLLAIEAELNSGKV
jgi:enolase